MRLLVVRLSSLGDVVCSLPAAAWLKAAFPTAHVTWAIDPRFRGIVECCRYVDAVVVTKPKFQPTSWPTLEEDFDAVLDLQSLSKSAIVAWRARSKLKLGYHWQREGSGFVSRPVMPDPSSIHVVDQYADVARAGIVALGGELTEPADIFGLCPLSEDEAAVSAKLRELDVDRPYVLLNPGAGWATKRWPAVFFGALSDHIWERGYIPVAIGGAAPSDLAVYDEVAAAATKAPIKATGATTVRELVALVARAHAHIGGDTGSSHLAAALGVPAISLYSITRPERSCPFRQIGSCLSDPRSLAHIPPEAVFEKLAL